MQSGVIKQMVTLKQTDINKDVPVHCVNGKCQQHETFFNIQDFVELNI